MSTSSATPRHNVLPGAAELAVALVLIGFVLTTLFTFHANLKARAEAMQHASDMKIQIMEAEAARVLGEDITPDRSVEMPALPAPDQTDHSPLPDIPWTPVLLGAGGLVLLGSSGVGAHTLRRRHQHRVEVAADIRARWNAATAGHNAIADEYAGLRLDPAEAIDHASLWDTTDPHTETFVLAYAKIVETRVEYAQAPPADAVVVNAYTDDVEAARRAWVAARENAGRLGLPAARAEQGPILRTQAALTSKARILAAKARHRILATV
jgi:hypothetical protein